MGTIIVIAILVIIILFAMRGSFSHFKGEGGCCGGSSDKPEKKKLEGEKVAEKIIRIEGMHCENCKNSVEKQINQIDGAVAKVNLKKNIATVAMSRMVSDEELTTAVRKAGFEVTDIKTGSF